MEINKIYNENCLETMSKMDDNFIDLVLTSPPYDNLRDYDGYNFDFKNIAKELYRIVKDGGVVVWIVGDQVIDGDETGTSFKQALYFKEIGFKLHDTMIYQKNNFSNPSNQRYHQIFEYMFILTKGKIKTVNLIKDRKNKYSQSWGKSSSRQKNGILKEKESKKYNDFGARTNIWKYIIGYGFNTNDAFVYEHPAIFPEKLAIDHILSWSNKNDIVYDPFMGSGTTAKGCILSRRNFIGSEISSKYCEIANKRVNAYMNQQVLEF